MIKLKEVYKHYDAKLQCTFIFMYVTFEINEGEFASIMGSSGP